MSALPSFGYMLESYRRARALTHEQIARQVGHSAETIRRIEAGQLRPGRQLAELLAIQLAIPADERALFVKAARAEPLDEQVVPLGPVRKAEAAGPPLIELPHGMITFLFTDIEGSTQLWERFPQAMPGALARHDALLRQSVERHGGVVFKGTGDGLHAAFERPADALAAALAAQRALRDEPWAATGPLRARMAIHTGAAELRDGDYFGRALNRAARLMSAGHGGQVLVSGVAVQLLREDLPEGVVLRSLGTHRLKDLPGAEEIFQLVAGDLPDAFPALRTLGARQANLPLQPTPLVGRERELAAVRGALAPPGARLLTLTGPGGIGKTRLAIQAAAELLDDFADGVCFVNLAPVGQAALVASSIAQALGARESGDPLASILSELRDKSILLLLDNFEQVVEAAPLVARLLEVCPRLNVLVTTRQALHLRGEKELPVPPLALPERVENAPAERLAAYAAVALFVQRARDVKPSFVMNDENAGAIAAICQRLDGLPLAIELAAGWIKLLPPAALLARLEHRLPLLRGGPRDLPIRQQTLRDAIAWSYDLLDAGMQRLFRRLAVFAGGCTLDAAEGICGEARDLGLEAWRIEATSRLTPQASNLIDVIAALVDQSLLRQSEGQDGAPRFVMLETIREYGLERLAEHDELDIMRERHARWFLALVREAAVALTGSRQQLWLDRLEQEHGNVRAAIQAALDRDDVEQALEFCAALWKFWQFHCHYADGGHWMDLALARSAAIRSALRAQVLCGAGWLAFSQGDLDRAEERFDASLALARELGDAAGVAMALHGVGQIAQLRGDYARAGAHYEASLALFRELGNAEEIAWSLHHLGKLAREQGDDRGALARFDECLGLFRQVGHRWGTTLALVHLGYAAYLRGDLSSARAQCQQALELARELGDRGIGGLLLTYLAEIAWLQGDDPEALALSLEGLALARDMRNSEGIAWCLLGLARLARARLDPAQAARFFGAAERLLDTSGIQFGPADRAAWEQNLAVAREQLDARACAAAWAEGRNLEVEATLNGGIALERAESRLPDRSLPAPP